MPTRSGLDYLIKMSLGEGTSSQLTQDLAFMDFIEKIDRLVQAMKVHRELFLHIMRDSQEGKRVHIDHVQDYHLGHGFMRVEESTFDGRSNPRHFLD